jgi:hypothetical protein
MSGRIVQAGDIYVYGFFVASGLGATGLTVTIDVWRNRAGTVTEVVAAGSATQAGDGLYYYKIDTSNVAAGDDFMYVFKTAGTADQKNVGGVVFVESNWTATKAGYLTGDAYVRLGAPAGASTAADIAAVKTDTGNIYSRQGAPTGASQSADVAAISTKLGTPAGASVSVDIAAVKTDTGNILTNLAAAPAAVWAYLTSAATTVGSLGKLLVDYITGNSYTRLGAPAGASIAADIAAIPAAVNTLLAANVTTVRSPVLTRSSIEVVIGTSYRDTDGVPLEWVIGAAPDLTGFTLYAKIAGVAISTCSITNAGTSAQTLTIEPTAAETATMAAGLRDFIVYATNTTPNPDATVALIIGKADIIDGGL